MDPNISGSLEDQVSELRLRVRRLEEALAGRGITLGREHAAPAARDAGAAAMGPAPSASALGMGLPVSPALTPAQSPIAPPRFGLTDQAKPEESRSLESRIGSHWFNRVAILAILIGMAWFLKMAMDNHWIGPLGRVLIGLIAGAGLIAWSERFRKPRI